MQTEKQEEGVDKVMPENKESGKGPGKGINRQKAVTTRLNEIALRKKSK